MDRTNYKSCYGSLERYIKDKGYEKLPVKKLFENVITINNIIAACALYYKNSNKTQRMAAVDRFMISMDVFYDWLKTTGVECKSLENKCNHRSIKNQVCKIIGEELKHIEYVPIDDAIQLRIDEIVKTLNDNKYYSYDQKLIYLLLNEYGFKPCVIVNMLYEDYDRERQRLVIKSDTYGKVNLKINDRIVDMFERYIELQEYKSRKYMFTYPNGKQLKTNNIMETLAEKLRNENLKEASACRISLKGVEKLIKQGLL